MQTNKVLTKMLLWQLVVAVVIGLIAFLIYGKSASISAVLGSVSVLFGAVFASLVYARNKNKQDATSVLVSLIVAEVVKLAFIFIFLFLVFKQYKSLVPAALIIGLMISAIVSGATIGRQKNKF